jgi:hypothetical protein
MRDEMDARMWLEHGAAFGRNVADLFAGLKPALERIHAFHFSAPWREDGGRARSREA